MTFGSIPSCLAASRRFIYCFVRANDRVKTPTMDAALAPIYAILSNLKKAWEEGQLELEIDGTITKIGAKDVERKVAALLKNGNREEARRLVAEHEQVRSDDDEIPEPRLTYNDSTVEKLGVMLNGDPYGLLLERDELSGFLAKMEYEEYQNERAFYLKAFKGFGSYDYDRIGRGHLHIENCTLSIIGGIQPARIAPLVRGAAVGVSDDGLI